MEQEKQDQSCFQIGISSNSGNLSKKDDIFSHMLANLEMGFGLIVV